MKHKGFTLVELVVVLAIVGVIAAILVPSLIGYVRKSRLKTANVNAKTVYNAIAEYVVDEDTKGNPIDWSKVAGTYSGKETTIGLDDTIAEKVHAVLEPNGNEAGETYIDIHMFGTTEGFYTHWRKREDSLIGQYPEAIQFTDDSVEWTSFY